LFRTSDRNKKGLLPLENFTTTRHNLNLKQIIKVNGYYSTRQHMAGRAAKPSDIEQYPNILKRLIEHFEVFLSHASSLHEKSKLKNQALQQ